LQVLPFAQYYIDLLSSLGVTALDLSTPFDEQSLLTSLAPLIQRELDVQSIVIARL
jgi:hypothetical protein